MQLVITLKKEVADETEAHALVAIVKTKLEDQPSISVESYVHNKIDS